MTVKKYRAKPVVKKAIQFNGNNCFDCLKFMNRASDIWEAELQERDHPYVYTPHGNIAPAKGDYIVKEPNGEFYVFRQEEFEKTYEEVSE